MKGRIHSMGNSHSISKSEAIRRLLAGSALFSLVLLSLLAVGATAKASGPVYWKSLSIPPISSQIKPKSINVSSGTGSGTFSVVSMSRWTGWGTRTAQSIGVARVKDCVPSCAEGGVKSRRAKVKLSSIRNVCGQRRYMNIEIRVFDKPKAWTFGPWGSDCRGAQIKKPYGAKPKARLVERTCGLLPGDGAYGYVKTRGVTCRTGWRVSRKARKKFCANRNGCSFAPYTPDSIQRTYRGGVKRNGWRCSGVVKWEFSRFICRKGERFIRAEGGA
jgi:hypothetical protein